MKTRKLERKAVKKDTRCVGYSLLLYIVITSVIGLLAPILANVCGFDVAIAENVALVAAPLLGLGFMFLFFRKKDVIRQTFKTEKKMTGSRFLVLLCFFLGAVLIASQANYYQEHFWKSIGKTMYSPALTELLSMDNVVMLLVAWIVAPIGEELIFRGLLLRRLEKYGKVLAILVTSLLFGLLHMNFAQSVNAFCLGLVLGYVAMEYSVIWSILLHVIQNLVVCSLLPEIAAGLNATTASALAIFAAIVCLVVCIVALIRNWKELEKWFQDNMWENKRMTWILTTFSAVLFILVCLVCALLILGRL